MRIYEEVFQTILSSFSQVPPEYGGILGQKNGVICTYLHDCKPQSIECAVYVPDIDWMNRCIQEWEPLGIEFAGIVHSHPPECTTLSGPDCAYIGKIMQAMPSYITELFFPILIPGTGMFAYSVSPGGDSYTIKPDSIDILKSNAI